ncbi:MAG: cell wall hydrolase [Lachnospiraceae bacterium]|nr:cell wall hydrolase [Lachnospiraceae bacterium]
MKRKISELLTNTCAIISALFILWIFISWINVLITRPYVPEWNFFKVLIAHGENHKEYKSILAEYEQYKGELRLQLKQKYTYSSDNVWYLSHVMAAEAGADWTSDEAVFYVGSVVLNRVESHIFPNTIKEVVLQHGQYATVPYLSRYEPSERVMEITYDLLNEGSVLPENVLYQANFRQGSGTYTIEQGMYFCYQ